MNQTHSGNHEEITPTIKPTLIERLNESLPVPFVIATLIVAVLVGPLGFYIATLLQYLDLTRTTTSFINNSVDHYTLTEIVGNSVVYPGIAFYSAYMLRYMRRRINMVEQQLERESPEWRGIIRKSFGNMSRTGPVVAITLLIVLLSFPLLAFQISNNQGFARLYFIISYPLFFFGAGTFIWTYVSSLWGLYKIGTEPLKLKPHTEDRLLGLGGFGRISLTMTIVFLVAVFLAIYEFTVFAAATPLVSTTLLAGFLITLGVSMFFLPLMNIHKRMIGERERLRSHTLSAIRDIVLEENTGKDRSSVHSLRKILLLEHESEQINAIASWPFDTSAIRLLAGVVFGLVISISAHLIVVSLNI